MEKELQEIISEKNYNPQSEELINLNREIFSNLSLCYSNINKFEESISLDLKLISFDPKYDESYLRLFNNYLKLNKKDQAVYFGDILLRNFDSDTKEKYKEYIPLIEKEKKNLEIEYEIEKGKQRKEKILNRIKFIVPLIILIVAINVYNYKYKK